jgi:hypothetical protein
MSDLTRFPLCWPHNVPRRPPHLRKKPLFADRSVSAATNQLLQEINRLNHRSWNFSDRSVIVSTNVRLKKDGMPYSGQAEPQDTGVAVYFNLMFMRAGKCQARHTVLSCDRWSKVGYNLTAIANDIEAQRARERWGCTSVEQAFAGYLAIPERCGVRPWWEILNVPSDACHDAIQEAFRDMAHDAHPDKGGDPERWHELQTAYGQGLEAAGVKR